MPQAPIWVAVALFAVLVAAAVPVLIQLRRTLASVETTLRTTAQRVDATLEELTKTLDRVNVAVTELERGAQHAASLFEALGGIGDAVAKLRSTFGTVAAMGASIGPILVAAVRAAFTGRETEARVEP